MARPGTTPSAFASASTYTAGSGAPAGLVGTSVRVAAPSSFYQFGFVPGATFRSQWVNSALGLTIDWVRWVSEGTSTMTKTAHLVETDSSGIARLWGLRLGDGTATGLNATQKLTVIGDGTQRAVDIDVPAAGLEGAAITSDSDIAPALTIMSTRTQGSAFFDASGSSNPTLELVATTQSAIQASSTDGITIQAEATGAATECAIKGTGDVCGVRGVASATGGAGIVGTTAAAASSSAEGVRGAAFGDGVGGRFSAEDGAAISASATGEEDVIVALASGDGAGLRLNSQSQPTVQRVGQFWVEEYDSDRSVPRYCSNATGLAPVDNYLWGGESPLIHVIDWDPAIVSVAENVTNSVLIDVQAQNPFGGTTRVIVEGQLTAVANPIGAIPLTSSLTISLHDNTAATTISTDEMHLIGATQRTRFTIRATYDLPSGTSTIRLRASVPAGAGGSIDFSHLSISVTTAAGGLY